MPAQDRLKQLMPVVAAVTCLAAIVAAAGLWRLGSETGKRACIEKAQARYPAVSVSAFAPRNGAGSGPLKLSYDRERRAAVDKCD